VDDNSGVNWSVAVSACSTGAFNGIRFAEGSPVILGAGSPNNIGDNFDLATTGGAATNRGVSGFGNFGRVYMNYDDTNLYVGAEGVDLLAGSNNAMIVFLAFDTLTDNSENFWNMNDQDPMGLDLLHNVAFFPAVDVAILLGDVYGDGTFTNFNMYDPAGFQFGQGVYYLNSGGSNFWPMDSAKLSQFDGIGTTACTSTWDSGSRIMTRWECALPWDSLNASNGIDSITNCYLSGLIVSSSTTNNDRYISGQYLGLKSTSGTMDEYGSFGFNFVVLNGMPVTKPESYVHGVPVSWINEMFGEGYSLTETSDFDEDGMSDREEYFAATNPKDFFSCFEMGSVAATRAVGDNVIIRWRSTSGQSYDLYRAPNVTGTYGLVEGSIIARPPENVYTDNVSGLDAQFYKVRTGR